MHTIAKSRYTLIALGLLAVTAPAFAQETPTKNTTLPALPILAQGVPATPAIPTTPTAPEAPAAPPTIDPQAKGLLDQTLDHYRTLKSFSVVYERSGRKQLIEFSAPQNLKVTRFDSDGKVRTQQFYTPTELITLQRPTDDFEWTTGPLPPAAPGLEGRAKLATTNAGGALFANILAGVDPFREGGRYPNSSFALGKADTIEGVPVTPVIVTTPKSEQQRFETVTTFYISQDKIIQSIKTETKLPAGRSSSSSESFSKIQPNIAFAAETFVFTPPAGATKVERFSSPKVRAVVGQAPLSLGTNVKDLVGKNIDFSQYKGKVVLVDFWATWCGPCIAELPNVKANYAKYKDQGFDVLGISLDQSTEPLTKYIAEKEMPWRQVFDGYWDGPIATSYNVRAIPSTILIGKDGKIAAIGARGDALEPAIKAALAAPGA